jgi:hypothetical protein
VLDGASFAASVIGSLRMPCVAPQSLRTLFPWLWPIGFTPMPGGKPDYPARLTVAKFDVLLHDLTSTWCATDEDPRSHKPRPRRSRSGRVALQHRHPVQERDSPALRDAASRQRLRLGAR